MTCWVDPETGDVYDHEANVVGNLVDSHDWSFSFSGDYPDEAKDVLYNAREGNQPSSYNQELLFNLAADQIEMGTPNDE